MTDTAAALVIQLSADFKDFKKQMQAATGVFDAEGRKIAARQAKLKAQLSDWTLDFTGLSGLRTALLGLTAVGIVTGIGDLIKKSLEAAAAIGDIADKAGVSTGFLQQMRFAAGQSGTSIETFDSALITLNKNLGEFVNTGAGKAAQTFKTLGIDKLIKSGDVRNAEQLFNVLIPKINAYGSAAQQSAFLSTLFGKEAGPNLRQLINQGADGISKLEAEARSLGIVLSGDTIKGANDANNRLNALFDVIKAEGVAAIAKLAPEIEDLAKRLTDGLPHLVEWVDRWAQWFGLIEKSPIQKLQDEIVALNSEIEAKVALQRSGNPFVDNDAIAADIAKYQQLLAKLDALRKSETGASTPKRASDVGTAPLHINDIDGAKRAKELADRLKAEGDARKQALDRMLQEQGRANAEMTQADDELHLQLLTGLTGYSAAVLTKIDDERKAKLKAIDIEETTEKDSLDRLKGLNEADRRDRIKIIKDIAAARAKAAEADAAAQRAAELERVRNDFSSLASGLGTNPFGPGVGVAQSSAQTDLNKETALQQSQLEAAHAQGLVSEQQYQDALLAIRQDNTAKSIALASQYEDARLALGETTFDALATGLGDLFGKQSAAYKVAFGIEKAFQIARAALAIEVAVAQALAAPFPENLVYVSEAIAAGGQIMSAIGAISGNGFMTGGYTGSGPRTAPAGLVHKGEFVFDQAATRRIGIPALQALQFGYTPPTIGRARSGGGPTVNIIHDGSTAVRVEKTSVDEIRIVAAQVVHAEGPRMMESQAQNPNSRGAQAIKRVVGRKS